MHWVVVFLFSSGQLHATATLPGIPPQFPAVSSHPASAATASRACGYMPTWIRQAGEELAAFEHLSGLQALRREGLPTALAESPELQPGDQEAVAGGGAKARLSQPAPASP